MKAIVMIQKWQTQRTKSLLQPQDLKSLPVKIRNFNSEVKQSEKFNSEDKKILSVIFDAYFR